MSENTDLARKQKTRMDYYYHKEELVNAIFRLQDPD